MMKIKNSELNESAAVAFTELLNIDLPVSMSWQIAKLAKEIDELIVLRKDALNKIVEKFAEKDEEGEMVAVQDEDGKDIPNSTKITDPEAYSKSIEEFENIENELPFDKISISILEEKNDNIKPSVLFNLTFLFTD